MALFTDGPAVGIEDLGAYDSGLLEVAGAESIDVTKKLALAQDEIAAELTVVLPELLPTATLGNIGITSPLRMWQVFRTLTLVYRDAYYSQLNDRYSGKRDEFEKLARWAHDKLLQTGVGIVWTPVGRAGAPQLSTAPGMLEPGTLFASVAWVNADGEEGSAGPVASIALAAGTTALVRGGTAPPNGVCWNLYAGWAADQMFRQNSAPLADSAEWMQPAPLASSGAVPGTGQEPNCLRAMVNMLRRG